MIDFRRKLWLNIMEDLGPPEGCILPTWLWLVYALLFPLHWLKCFLHDVSGFDPWRMVWRIHGIEFADSMFAYMAEANGELYRFANVNGVITIQRVFTIEEASRALADPNARMPWWVAGHGPDLG